MSMDKQMTTAHDILAAAQGHMKDRAATYDRPEGERSMGATVEAFKAVTSHCLTEEQGWLFMALLKAVRSQQGALRMDSYEDGAAYFALAGETAARDRTGQVARELYTEADEKRMDVVGTNGNDGEHYWQINSGADPDIDQGSIRSTLAAALNKIYEDHGVCITDVNAEWIDASTCEESKKILTFLEIEADL